jgi:peptidoglycan/LPS O-acetylase OafA/YrhL
MDTTDGPGTPASAGRILTVDCMRGIAASAVVWFHLTNGNSVVMSEWLRASGRQGWIGVEMFFVISGFVIPHALLASAFRLEHYGPFVLRRIVRLDPPYFVSMLLTIALAYLSAARPGFGGSPPDYTALQLASHVAYVTGFFGLRWINVVYWSLSLELQYYLLIALLFPLLANGRAVVRMTTVAALCATSLIVRNPLFVFGWLGLFALGILAFQKRHSMLSVPQYVVAVALASAAVAVTGGPAVALVAAATTLLIAFATFEHRLLLFLGTISYSLYLVHVPVGGRVMNAVGHAQLGPTATVAATCAAFAISVTVAYVFYIAIERPARRWATHIQYARGAGSAVAAVAVAGTNTP